MSFSRGAAGFNRSVLNRDEFGDTFEFSTSGESSSVSSTIVIDRIINTNYSKHTGFNRGKFNSITFSRAFDFTTSGESSSVTSTFVIDRIIDELTNVRGGFNTQPHNRDDFGSVLYCLAESNTISSTECAADSIFFVIGTSKTVSSTEITDKIYNVISMVFSGDLAVGERVCIDGIKYTVLLGGVNAIDKFTGNFPEIMSGDNTVTYTDSESARTVKVIVTRRDRSI